MGFFKFKLPRFSRFAWALIAGLFVVPTAIYAYQAVWDFLPGQTTVTICAIVLVAYYAGAALYAIIVNRVPQRLWKWFKATCWDTRFDIGVFRIICTLLMVSLISCLFIHELNWLCLPGVAAIGVTLCIYFGHLLLFRLQCSLLELLAITTTFGLIDGLVLSTPGALKFGLYLSPTLAAWILYAAVSGIVTATLSGANGTGARLLHIFAAMLSVSAFAFLGLGAAILIASESEKYGMATYRICAWPLIAAGIIGFGLNIRLGIKTKKRAQALLKPAPESVLNSLALDAKP